MTDEVLAPVRGLLHLRAQPLDRQAELRPVGLDGGTDLLGCALAGHQVRLCWSWDVDVVPRTAPTLVDGGAVMVWRMSCASSIAICGVGGEPRLMKRAARNPAIPPMMNKI